MKDHSWDCWAATKLTSALCRRVMGVRTCESRCLFSGSKGEVCCIEPLHAKVDLRDHPITQYSLLAMASLTKVTCCLQEAWCERWQRRSSLLYTQTCYFALLLSLKILVIGLKPSLKVWMTFPYGRVSNEAKQVLFGLWLQTFSWREGDEIRNRCLVPLPYTALWNYSDNLWVWCVQIMAERRWEAASSCTSVKLLIFSNKQEGAPQLLVFPAADWMHPQMGCWPDMAAVTLDWGLCFTLEPYNRPLIYRGRNQEDLEH